MSPVFVLPCMLFMHVLDDFVLQTVVLSKLKQKSWWEANAPERGYRYDYLAALTAHAISWSFCVMFPIAIYRGFFPGPAFYAFMAVNAAVHGLVDHLKANRKRINLIMDQSAHVYQMLLTYLALVWL